MPMQQQVTPSRRIPVPGTYNVRDVGGYPTHEGLDVRWGALYRADGLGGVGPEGLNTLAAVGARTVIDLRRDAETVRSPNPCASDPRFRYHNIPLAFGPSGPASHPRDLAELYLAYLDHGQASIREVMAAIAAAPPEEGVLVHCTAGKDRTGVVVALALGVAGVVPEAIVQDYLLTGPLIEPLRHILREVAAREGQDVAALEPLLRCERPAIQAALHHVDSRYGSAAGYLMVAGLAGHDLDRIRMRLLGA